MSLEEEPWIYKGIIIKTQNTIEHKYHHKNQQHGDHTHIPIITLSISGLNSPIKRPKWMDQKIKSIYLLSTKNPTKQTHFSFKDRYCLWVKGWMKIVQSNGTRKQAGATILISDNNRHVKVDRRKATKLQPYTESCRKLRNARSRRNSRPQGRTQLVI